jgi:nucleotide-binding universal stress UspA family protein
MATLCRILVPTDFSRSSEGALDYAWFLARRVGGAIDLLHVVDTPTGVERGADDRSFSADSASGVAMQRALSVRQQFGGVEILGHLEIGDPCEMIVRVATTGAFDLIVMGQGGQPTGARSFSGSTARRVAHSVHCPVIKVRAAVEVATGSLSDNRALCRPAFRAA